MTLKVLKVILYNPTCAPNAEIKQGKSPANTELLLKLKDVAYDAENAKSITTGVEEESHIAIGKTIVKKCGRSIGNQALGSLMRFKSHESEWSESWRELEHRRLENVSNTKDAKKANLMTKNHLTSLGLLWTDGDEKHTPQNIMKNFYKVSNLITILKQFTLSRIKVPSFQTGYLDLHEMDSLKYLDDEKLAAFPEGFLQNNNALEKLRIDSLAITTLSNVLDNLSALKVLYLCDCNHLEFLPEGLKNLGSLETLEIFDCDETEALVRTNDTNNSLQDLELIALPELKDLPESMQLFSALEQLDIWAVKDYAPCQTAGES
ncbi:hypothetical protein Sango_2998800 [Sesamum angolense]|uniref:R13L1/DRL21-like LRR repeat region domain-containing protein n=1 Tax=Sesamum angolense TaxID=2727404 RepID=A0AAE1VSV2_9LAMI|nr:hypothetical protein Sango_2998800 [Sesamum angolense]